MGSGTRSTSTSAILNADPTTVPAVPEGHQVGEGMASIARHARLGPTRWEHAATLGIPIAHVVGLGTEEQVVRIYARWVIAVVADGQAIRDLAISDLPRKTVGSCVPDTAIAFGASRTGPFPALTLRSDLRPEVVGRDKSGLGVDRRAVERHGES